MSEFIIGCNYWDSNSGTDMWRDWNEEAVRDDLTALEKCGMQYLRVFTNWRDFQPVKKLYGWANTFKEYVVGDNNEYLDENEFGLDYVVVDRFRTFAEIAKEHNMKLIVSIVTGWMSGKMFTPPALENQNLLKHAEALMWTEKFVRGIVSALKDIDNIIMWDLGNESNNISIAESRAEAYNWTALVRNAILSEDNTRPISSGMHDLDGETDGKWLIADQGALCDIVTVHPYPSAQVRADFEAYNRMRTTMIPSAESEYYSGIAGKPCMIQEIGVYSPMCGNEAMAADSVRVNLLSGWANNISGYLWWCGMEHLALKQPPYSWCMMERSLGLLNLDKSPRPAALEMQKMKNVINGLPDIAEKDREAVCVLPKTDKFANAIGTYILAKQAGFNITIVNEGTKIPESDMYIVPGCTEFDVMLLRTWDYLIDRVENHGAKLVITNDGAHFVEIDRFFGLKSHGMSEGKEHTAKFSFGEIKYKNKKDTVLESVGAEVLATDETGNVVLSRNKLGKGQVYFLNIAVEQYAHDMAEGFNPECSQEFYKIYREFAKEQIDKYVVTSENPYIGITQSKNADGSYILTAVNYSDKDIEPNLVAKNGWKTDVLYGDTKLIKKCDAVIMKVYK